MRTALETSDKGIRLHETVPVNSHNQTKSSLGLGTNSFKSHCILLSLASNLGSLNPMFN